MLGFSFHMWDLIPWWGIKLVTSALVAWSLSHWTTREVPRNLKYNEKWIWGIICKFFFSPWIFTSWLCLVVIGVIKFGWKGTPNFLSHLRRRPVSHWNPRGSLVGRATFQKTPISLTTQDKSRCLGNSSNDILGWSHCLASPVPRKGFTCSQWPRKLPMWSRDLAFLDSSWAELQ